MPRRLPVLSPRARGIPAGGCHGQPISSAGRKERLRRCAGARAGEGPRPAGPSIVAPVPQNEAGLPDLDALLGTPEEGTLVYCCGPEGLLAAVEERCAAWPAGALRVERFAPKAGAAAGRARAFEVVLARSGLTVEVAADRSVFDAVQDAGVSVLGSCHEGICGTCEQVVLDGEVDHRDSVLSAGEQAAHDAMMICVSRAKSGRLTLDL